MFRPSDEVVVKVSENVIVSSDAVTYEETIILEVIATYEGGYILYVPSWRRIKDTININKYNYNKYSLDSRYIDSETVFLHESDILKLHRRHHGKKCSRCREFCHDADSDSVDSSFKCFSCRNNPYR